MVPCAIGQDIDSKSQSGMCSPYTKRIMGYDFMRHKAKSCSQYNKITWEAGIQKIAVQTKGSIWRKNITCFFKGFHSGAFRDITIKGFNRILTVWKWQRRPGTCVVHDLFFFSSQSVKCQRPVSNPKFAKSAKYLHWNKYDINIFLSTSTTKYVGRMKI